MLCVRKSQAGSAVVRWVLVLLVVALMAGLLWRQLMAREQVHREVGVVLLVPDGMPPDDIHVQIWRDAAQEEGVLLRPMPVGEWVRVSSYWAAGDLPAVILPDKFHRQVSDATTSALVRFVEAGGRLMLVQDGGLLDENGHYPKGAARLSNLAGVVYGEYEQQAGDISRFEAVQGLASFFDRLHLPPGRYQPLTTEANNLSVPLEWSAKDEVRVSVYSSELNKFPVLRTRNADPNAQELLSTIDGIVVAQSHRHGKGMTLFVNLPLTHLKQQTDGVFLHGFLRYFAHDLLAQPQLSPTPNNQGVLVLNWHNDDRLAIHYLQVLQDAGIFDHGHQSMHFTAGPDVDEEGDGKGMDLPNNPAAQAMLSKLASQGHSIGNHGGWIHNHYGAQASDDNGEEYEAFLDLNNEAVVAANGGRLVLEYSAPQGNQPLWTYDWLARRGNVAYYTTSNIGAAPTRVWMAERRMGGGWGFPVMTNGRIASAEEAYAHRVTPERFGAWLMALGDFIERQRVMRLAYFHPVGATLYLPQVKALVDQVQACANRDACRFLSMTEAANFLERRVATKWQVTQQGSLQELKAINPQGLQELVWLLPKATHQAVRVVQGDAQVHERASEFEVHVRAGTELVLQLTP